MSSWLNFSLKRNNDPAVITYQRIPMNRGLFNAPHSWMLLLKPLKCLLIVSQSEASADRRVGDAARRGELLRASASHKELCRRSWAPLLYDCFLSCRATINPLSPPLTLSFHLIYIPLSSEPLPPAATFYYVSLSPYSASPSRLYCRVFRREILFFFPP